LLRKKSIFKLIIVWIKYIKTNPTKTKVWRDQINLVKK